MCMRSGAHVARKERGECVQSLVKKMRIAAGGCVRISYAFVCVYVCVRRAGAKPPRAKEAHA